MYAKCLAALLLLSLAHDATAYRVLDKYVKDEPEATYDPSTISNNSRERSKWRTVLGKAADSWEDTGHFNWRRSSSSPNKIYLQAIDGVGGDLATVNPIDGENGAFEIVFDEDENWSTSSGTPSSSRRDARSVATHEFGHALGLAHPRDSDCRSAKSDSKRPTMCQSRFFKKRNETYRRSLEPDDEAGVEALYGSDSADSSSQPLAASGRRVSHTVATCRQVETDEIAPIDLIRDADVIVHGVISSVTPTFWNSNDRAPWHRRGPGSASLPLHLVGMTVLDILAGELPDHAITNHLEFHVARTSPVDYPACASSGPFSPGQEVVILLRVRPLAWKTEKFRELLQPSGPPAASALVMSAGGLLKFLESHRSSVSYSMASLRAFVALARSPR